MKRGYSSGIDDKTVVRQGYDLCASAYDEAREIEAPRELSLLSGNLQPGGAVLDIGCGAGVPIAKELARDFAVTGVDISQEMVRLALKNVPLGTFIHQDIMSADFAPSTFDGAVAYYVIFHLPRQEHPLLFRRVYQWLKPGGYLLATLAVSGRAGYTEDNFFGVNMFWSNYGLEEYNRILNEIGFNVLEITALGHGYTEAYSAEAEHHPLVLAQKK